MLTILHHAQCSKSNCALNLLQQSKKDFIIRDYIAQPLLREEILELLRKLRLPAESIVRKEERLFTALYGDAELCEADWVELLLKHPELLQRPIIIQDDNAFIARPPEKVYEIG